MEIETNTLEKIFNFAKKMTKNHHKHFVGEEVTEERDEREIFENVIRGKIAEEVVFTYIQEKYPKAEISTPIDYDVYGLGEWDGSDLIVNGKQISIKASKSNAVALFLESYRFFNNGRYKYQNKDGKEKEVHSYIFVHVDIPGGFISWDDYKKDFKHFIERHNPDEIRAEIKGFITHKKFWEMKTFIPRGTSMTKKNLYDILIEKIPPQKTSQQSKVKMLANNFGIHLKQLKPF